MEVWAMETREKKFGVRGDLVSVNHNTVAESLAKSPDPRFFRARDLCLNDHLHCSASPHTCTASVVVSDGVLHVTCQKNRVEHQLDHKISSSPLLTFFFAYLQRQ